MRYRVTGSGPPLLLVHGLMTTGYSWRYAVAQLASEFTVYIPDLVGCGESDKPARRYPPEAVAETLGAFVTALSLRGCAAIGNSMGGYLCMHLALQDRSVFSRLVNLHSPGLATARMVALRCALKSVPIWERALRAIVQRDPLKWVHRNVHYYDESLKSQEEHRVYGHPLSTASGFSAFARALEDTLDVRAMRRFERALRALGESPLPLQLVYARRDPMVPPSVGARLHALLPDSELVWLDEASHFAHVDATERFLDVAMPFLLREPGA